MYSLVILFSNDRLKQLNVMHWCWRHLAEEFDDCEKILCVDGKLKQAPDGDWKIIEIPRRTKYYCWADALNTGVKAATQPIVLYYDADRIVPKGHVQYCLEVLYQRPAYVYAEQLYGLTDYVGGPFLCEAVHQYKAHLHKHLYPDFRINDPYTMEHKNPFSGGVAFRKETFLEHGGFDPRFIGWGYPDFDFLMNVTRKGGLFVKAPFVELHQKHGYSQGENTVALHNAWNCWQYVNKWGLDTTEVDAAWAKLRLPMSARGCSDIDEFLSCL